MLNYRTFDLDRGGFLSALGTAQVTLDYGSSLDRSRRLREERWEARLGFWAPLSRDLLRLASWL